MFYKLAEMIMTPPVGAATAANLACIEATAVIAAEAAPTQDFRLFMKHPG
jgi:hypothetical protein